MDSSFAKYLTPGSLDSALEVLDAGPWTHGITPTPHVPLLVFLCCAAHGTMPAMAHNPVLHHLDQELATNPMRKKPGSRYVQCQNSLLIKSVKASTSSETFQAMHAPHGMVAKRVHFSLNCLNLQPLYSIYSYASVLHRKHSA